MRKFFFLLIPMMALFVGVALAQTGELKGTVIDAATKEPVPFAAVILENGGSQVAGTKTDFDGNYFIKPITPGKYDVRVTVIGYTTTLETGVLIIGNKTSFLNKSISASTVQKDEVVITGYKIPVFERDQTSTGGALTSEQIKALPTRDINAAASTSAGVYQNTKSGEEGLNIKGGRADATVYFVDGVKVRGSSSVPQSAIEQVSVLTGGVPAEFGDLSGGAVNITTKGPSRNYSGGLELVTSELIGKDGYNLAAGNLSGPLLLKNKGKEGERPLLGFAVSGEYQYHADPGLPSTDIYKVKDAKLKELQTKPLSVSRTNSSLLNVNSAEYITLSDLEKIERRQDVESRNIRGSAKLNFQPTLLTTLTLGLSGDFQKNRDYSVRRSLFNPDKNGYRTDNSYRVFLRYTQRFGQQSGDGNSTIKNAYYTIQADYSKQFIYQRDRDLKDDFFKYGYVGKFTTKTEKTFGQDDKFVTSNGDTITAIVENGRQDVEMTFDPASANPILSNYAQQYYDMFGMPTGITDYQARGGLINGAAPRDVYGLFDNVGRQVGYRTQENDQIRLTAKFGADIKKHAIQAGFEYEQRKDRDFNTLPRSLWTVGAQLVNTNLSIDKASASTKNPAAGEIVYYDYKSTDSIQSTFDRNLRAVLLEKGLIAKYTDFIDLNSLDPSLLSVNYFSADELIRNTTWNYSGYDYTGKKLTKKVAFNDFFTDKINRPMGAFEPIYMAGYIQDKFTINDLIVRVGVRVDRFDANQKVLKDKYTLFETRSKAEVDGSKNIRNGGFHPGSVGDDAVVYVDGKQTSNNSPVEITGYRVGDVFYNAIGEVVQDVNELKGADGSITPYFSENVQYKNDKPDFETSAASSFRDYKPQINVLPRVSFSFPISDEAVFFANYDVLSQRPQTNIFSQPVDYYLLSQLNSNSLANPDLKPQTTIDYQLGFKQKLTTSSALSITSFYRELRDQLQQVSILTAYPVGYTTSANRDFGTVKGLTIDYDLRRTGNASLRLSYTLQFANGTGSSANSAANLLASGQGSILIPLPLNYDQRNTLVASFDYRYGSGTSYNGPKALQSVLAGAGANVLFRAGSGTPFTRQELPTKLEADARFRNLAGSINGSRLPWSYNVDMRIDKDITIGKTKENKSNSQPAYLNVYFLVQNVFNFQNILNVYPATGNPDDDGYLTSPNGQKEAVQTTNPQSFALLYQYRVNDPNNYSAPRLVRLGASINF